MGIEGLAGKKKLFSVIIAGGLLAAIFVPFQKADAFEVDLDLPNVTDLDEVPTSAVGSTFEITIDVAAGELISIDSIQLVLDNGEESIKNAIFDSDGQRIGGVPTLTRGNLDVTISSTTSGYGYGYGYVADSITATSPPYTYTIVNPSYTYISGNNVGYTNEVGSLVTGLLGPGTITITGKLNTALMEEDVPHTLDVLIDTGTGTDPDHLVAPQLTFTTLGNSAINQEDVGTGDDVEVEPDIPGVDPGKFKIKFSKVNGAGKLIVHPQTPEELQDSFEGIFESLSASGGKFSFGGEDANVFGDMFDIDVSSITLEDDGTYTITIPYDEDLLPQGISEDDLKLFHYDEDTEEWEDITTEVDTDANTITGETDSLSPVAAGYTSTTGGGGGGGGGGAGGSQVFVNETFQPSYFVDHPLAKMRVDEATIVTSSGSNVLQGRPGQQVSLMASFHNAQTVAQDYAIIFQVIDEDGFTSDIGWVTGTLASGQGTDASRSWTIGDEGDYTIRIFVWNGVSDLPTPLSEVTDKSFTSS